MAEYQLHRSQAASSKEADRSVKLLSYSAILEKYNSGQMNEFDESISFDQLATFFLEPGDDLESALNTHVKVCLKASAVYELNKPIKIQRSCYLIGNEATIKVNCPDSPVILVNNCLRGPQIGGIGCATFFNVKFVGDPAVKNTLLLVRSHLLLHGVQFFSFGNTVIRSSCGLTIKGCFFSNSYRCVKGDGDYRIIVKYSSFENCILGVSCKTDITLKNNSFVLVECALLLWGSGLIKCNNIVCPPSKHRLDMLTCLGGTVRPLATVHFVSNLSKKFPVMRENVFNRGVVYVGFRKNSFHPDRCNFNQTHICLDPNLGPKMCLWGSFDQSVTISRLRFLSPRTIICRCECGSRHKTSIPCFCVITAEFVNDPTLNSCHCLEYSSSEED